MAINTTATGTPITARTATQTWVLVATVLASSMVFIDSTVVNVALPILQRQLGATAADVQWVVEAYALFLAALILVGGALGDRLGRRRIFLTGTVIFALASAWCGLAPNITQLILARAVQGVGGALLTPGSLAIITATFSGPARGKAIGTWSGATAITAVLGPLVGGLLLGISWRLVFFINIPFAVGVIAVSLLFMPESRDEAEAHQPIDITGAILATLGLGGLVYGLTEAPVLGFGHPLVLGMLALGIGGLGAFVAVEARGATPMMPLNVFRSRPFTGANILTFLLYGALGGALYFVPFNLISVQGYPPVLAGAALLPSPILLFLLSSRMGTLGARIGPRRMLIIGPTIAALGFALFAVPGIGGNYFVTYFPAIFTLGLGMAITVAPLTTTVMTSLDGHLAGLSSGINNAMSRVAGLLAIAVLGIVVLAVFGATLPHSLGGLHLTPAVRQAILDQRVKLLAIPIPDGLTPATHTAVQHAINQSFIVAFRTATLIGAGMAALSALSAALFIPKTH